MLLKIFKRDFFLCIRISSRKGKQVFHRLDDSSGFHFVGTISHEVAVRGFITLGIIRPRVFPWEAPVLLFKRNEGTVRLCVNNVS